MSIYLYRLSRWCFRHRWATIATWLVILLASGVLALLGAGKTNNTIIIPGTEAQRALNVIDDKMPAASGASTQIIFVTSGDDIAAPGYVAAIGSARSALTAIGGQITDVSDPTQTGAVSADHRAALMFVTYDVDAAQVTDGTLDHIDQAVSVARAAGLQVELGGEVYPQHEAGISSEVIGLVVALFVLLLTFGSMVASGLPIVTALMGVLATTFVISALASFVDITSSATTVATLLGLSCGIDYALFILSRYRGYLLQGIPPQDAAGRAAGTAGSSVVFAGLSVIIALCGLSVVGIPFLTTMGLAAAGTVLVALLGSMTLVPAVFGVLGHRAGQFSRLGVLRRARQAAGTAVDRPEDLAGTRWARWVVHHRVAVVIVGVTVLGALCLPIGGMKLGLPGAGSNPTSDTSRRAYDLTTDHFGAGYNGTLTIVADNVRALPPATAIADTVGRLPGVRSSSVVGLGNGIALIEVVPTTGPGDPATADLVRLIRADRATLKSSTGADILVGGPVATNIDVSDKLAQALPIFLITIIVLAFILLTFAFRTILVPLKSILGFLLSSGAALGAQVAIFQWGWGASIIGVQPSETLSFLPVILLAIMFGLSSDYEVFVVSRIKEQYTKSGDARRSVVTGTGQSARVVTAAALIMVFIFISVLFDPDPVTKAIGFSFALGVLIDAFVVRLTLVPAIMAIVGGRLWYHPSWYGRYVPDPDIEGENLEQKIACSPAEPHSTNTPLKVGGTTSPDQAG